MAAVDVVSVVFDPDIYPRREVSEPTVARYIDVIASGTGNLNNQRNAWLVISVLNIAAAQMTLEVSA